ncbi:MAG: HupE/UreJ family protein, partial [Blastocatellales bacterium]
KRRGLAALQTLRANFESAVPVNSFLSGRCHETDRYSRISHFGPAICLLLVLIILAAATAFAHDPGLSAADLTLDGDKLTARLTFSRDEIAMIAPMEASLESLAKESFAISVDGKDAAPTAVAVNLGESNAIHFDLKFVAPEASKIILRSLLIGKLARGHRQLLSLRDADGKVLEQRMLDAASNSIECDPASLAASQSRPQSFWAFLLLGVEHILLGFDHLAFLLALLIAGGTLREAAKVITSFTVAHSITLALATLDVVNIPASVVEPLIAASIIYVGLENIFRREIKRRWVLTFAFGLVHGFGFASALGELGIGTSVEAVAPLLAFNLGVEAGQIAIAALALPLIWKLRQQPGFVIRYVPACSVLIAVAGGYWLIERTFF